MKYKCKKCGRPFDWTDPVDPTQSLSPRAVICPACRRGLEDRNKKKAMKAAKRRRRRAKREMEALNHCK